MTYADSNRKLVLRSIEVAEVNAYAGAALGAEHLILLLSVELVSGNSLLRIPMLGHICAVGVCSGHIQLL